MDTRRTLSLIRELGALQVFDLTLAGGEPTLHPDWLDILDCAVQQRLRVGLLTNGTQLDSAVVARLESIAQRGDLVVQVSLDSPEAAVNDDVRGNTAATLLGIDLLARSSVEVQLATVVHARNIETAHLMIDRFYPSVRRFHFLNVQRTAEALKHPELLLTEEETLAFWLGLRAHAGKFPDDLFLPSLRIQLRALGRGDLDPETVLHRGATWKSNACSAGWTHVNITTDFDVLGCDIAKDHTVMGNCMYESFENVWNSASAAAVRSAPYPACYKIESPSGERLADRLRAFVPAVRLSRKHPE